MKLIRKNALPLTFLSILAAALAAPFMIPENPDSMVFRSGWLGLILLVGCMPPVYEAYTRANRRQLIISFAFGYFFASALSLGSELFVYEGLLRGMGSLLRRVAVPVLATPLLGSLCYKFTQINPLNLKQPKLALPTWVYALIIFLCWVPVWLAFWPANIRFDFTGEYSQHLESSYSSLHPLLHSVIQNGIITLGELLISRNFGLMLLTLVQMLCLSIALGACCAFLQKRGVSFLSVALAFFFGFHPTFSVLAVSTTKDTMFTAAVVVQMLMIWSLIESPEDFFSRKRNYLGFIVVTLFTALLRNNGIFALILALPAAIIAAKGFWKKALAMCVAGAVASVGVFSILSILYQCESMPSRQLYSLPAQQLVRAYNLSPNLTEEDKQEIRSWYLSDNGLVLLPQLADPAKGYLNEDRLDEEGAAAYLSVWASHLGDSLHEYIEAFLMLNIGSWYPDDLTHSLIYPEQAWNGQGYISLSEPGITEQGFEMTCYLPSVRSLIQKICGANRYQRIPLVSLTFCPAFPFWLIILSCAVLASRRKMRYLPATLGVLGLWLSYLMGPCTLPRYSLPLFALAPVLLISTLLLPTADPSDSSTKRSTDLC